MASMTTNAIENRSPEVGRLFSAKEKSLDFMFDNAEEKSVNLTQGYAKEKSVNLTQGCPEAAPTYCRET